jgi:hypothetical protein
MMVLDSAPSLGNWWLKMILGWSWVYWWGSLSSSSLFFVLPRCLCIWGGKTKILELLILQQICNAVLTIKVSWGDIFPWGGCLCNIIMHATSPTDGALCLVRFRENYNIELQTLTASYSNVHDQWADQTNEWITLEFLMIYTNYSYFVKKKKRFSKWNLNKDESSQNLQIGFLITYNK